ncbi:MAG: hypothetical protein RQ732_08765 [Methylophaga sp.]|nr:hypothetical protein [Methylophaga sp.]
MKLPINCMQCFHENGHPSFEFQTTEVRDDGLYCSTCEKGHKTLTVIQEQKFEVLFAVGTLAIKDGYPREAISSIAASLERFYEFFIKVICLKNNIEISIFDEAWKDVSSQSERQYGAYLFTHLIDKNVNSPTIDNAKPLIPNLSKNKTLNWREFRNSVVHKGYIPTTEEAIAYADIVFNHINEIIADLKLSASEFIQKATFHHLSRSQELAGEMITSTMSIPTPVSLTRNQEEQLSFRTILKQADNYRNFFR